MIAEVGSCGRPQCTRSSFHAVPDECSDAGQRQPLTLDLDSCTAASWIDSEGQQWQLVAGAVRRVEQPFEVDPATLIEPRIDLHNGAPIVTTLRDFEGYGTAADLEDAGTDAWGMPTRIDSGPPRPSDLDIAQTVVQLELQLSACVTMLGSEVRITDHQLTAAADRPLEYHRIDALGTTVLRVKR